MPGPPEGFLGEVGRQARGETQLRTRQGRGAEEGVGFADPHPQEPPEVALASGTGLAVSPKLPGRRVPELLDGCQRGPSSPQTSTGSALGAGNAVCNAGLPGPLDYLPGRRLTPCKALLERPPGVACLPGTQPGSWLALLQVPLR